MPSSLHQGVVALFRDDPALGFDLLRSVFSIELPKLTRVSDRNSELDRFAPCFGDTGEVRIDLAVSAEVEHPEHPLAGIAMIIEVQKKIDHCKQWRLWVYWALLAERLKRPTAILVVPLSKAVSRWSRGLGDQEIPKRESLLVLDHQNMPRISDLAQARRRPAMAVLSALIHAVDHDLELAQIGLTVALELTDDRRWRYASSILSTVPEDERKRMIGALTMEQQYEFTELELNSMVYHDGLREGARKGKLEGKLEVLVELLLKILDLRQLPVDADTVARIRDCDDPERLQDWITRATLADRLAAVFA
jgi:hypothetical protein